MSNNRLNSRDRLYMLRGKNGIVVAASGQWRRTKPNKKEGNWVDVTSCITGCCSSTEPTQNSFMLFRNTTASANITDISFPGYSWTGTLATGQYLIVPLPYNLAETITIVVDTPTGRTLTTSTIQGTGTIAAIGAITLATNTTTITDTPESQYLVLLS